MGNFGADQAGEIGSSGMQLRTGMKAEIEYKDEQRNHQQLDTRAANYSCLRHKINKNISTF